MTHSPDTLPAGTSRDWQKPAGLPPGGWFAAGWKSIDPLYLWSAAAGLAVAFVLIAVAILMQSHVLH